MSKNTQPIPHYKFVDNSSIKAEFFDDNSHRATLFIPFIGRPTHETLCVVGQNPSKANEYFSDKTVRYIEEFVYNKLPQYGSILIINLYSRVDTKKHQSNDLYNEDCNASLKYAIKTHNDFLLIYGKLRNEGAYRFPERAREFNKMIRGKRLFKLDLNTIYPPHPGNRKILYKNFNIEMHAFDCIEIHLNTL